MSRGVLFHWTWPPTDYKSRQLRAHSEKACASVHRGAVSCLDNWTSMRKFPSSKGWHRGITEVQNSPLAFARIWPAPPQRAPSLLPFHLLPSASCGPLCIFPRYIFTTALAAWPLDPSCTCYPAPLLLSPFRGLP